MTPLEDAFLRNIHENPADEAPRLIYADWLDEGSDSAGAAKAEFLRLESALVNSPPEDERRAALTARLRELRADLDPSWVAAVTRTGIEHCHIRFRFRCPKQWDQLQVKDNPLVRFCTTCRKNVYYCSTVGEARKHARKGHCVAVDCTVPRKKGDVPKHAYAPRYTFPPYGRRMGRVLPHQIRRRSLPMVGEVLPDGG